MQYTLKRMFSLSGTGLHTGHPVRMRVLPAGAGEGIRFRRTDIHLLDNVVAAKYHAVVDTRRCTRLGNSDGVTVSTVEHLLAALAGCGIHNAVVELDGPEVPIMDGCSARFVREILRAGIQPLQASLHALRVLLPVRVEIGGAIAALSPADQLHIKFEIEFPDRAIGRQAAALTMANGAFVSELSDCRTFCRRDEVDFLRATGLAKGGTLDNAIVVDGDKVLNPGGFRRTDECVRHKMLDALGDLSLAGLPILGQYRGIRAGHGTTNALLRKMFATPGAFEMVTCTRQMENSLLGAGIQSADLSYAG